MDENAPKERAAPSERDVAFREATAVVPRLRTYASDMSRAIKSRGETLASIVGAEQRKHDTEKPLPLPSSRASWMLLAGAIILPIVGISVIVLAIFFTAKPKDVVQIPPSIIFSNATALIETDDERLLPDILSEKRKNGELLLGEIQRFVVVRQGVPLSPPEVARALGLPDEVAREVTKAMVGIHAFNYNQPFLLFEVLTYDRTFNALLEWEAVSARELGSFFAPRAAPTPVPRLIFSDVVLRNLDVRKSGGDWPILYAFPTRTMLLITTNEFTLREIMTRLGNTNRE